MPTCLLVSGFVIVAISTALSPALTAPAIAQCQYSTVVIEGPPCPFGGQSPLIGQGLNNHGHVVGWWNHCSDDGREAFFWSTESGLVTLPRPEGVFRAIAKDVNDHGVIVGEHWFSYSEIRAFVYDMDVGEFEYLQPLHGVGTSTANAINNQGVVAGRRSIGKSGEQPYNAVIWGTNTGEVVDLGAMNGPNSEALDIDETTRFIVGWTGGTALNNTGFVLRDGKLTLLDDVPTTDTSTAKAVNSHGVVVGDGVLLGEFVWLAYQWADDQMMLIQPAPSFASSRAECISNLEQIGIMMSDPGFKGYLYQHGSMINLSPAAGTNLQSAHLINDAGQIVGQHITPSAVLLTPIDQPFTDLDANCRTDVHDLIMLLDWWGECPPVKPGGADLCRADINGDGMVNVLDLLMLIGNWD